MADKGGLGRRSTQVCAYDPSCEIFKEDDQGTRVP